MKRLILMLLAMGLAIGIVVMVGCSDDEEDKGTGPVTLPDGDLMDPLFLEAVEPLMGASEIVPWGLEPMIMGMMYLWDSSGTPRAKPMGVNQPDTIWYDSVSQYWYARENGFDYNYGMSFFAFDSMQFIHGGTVAKWPDSTTLTQIKGGGNRLLTFVTANKDMAGDTGIYYTFEGSVAGAAGQVTGLGNVTANGTGTIYLLDLGGKNPSQFTCFYEMNDAFQANNVQFNIIAMYLLSDCPFAGYVEHNADLTLDCTGDTTFTNTDDWYLKETYVGDSVHYVIENSFYRWLFSEECTILR